MKLPQLSLRELFLLVVIAAMGCGWWVERERLANEIERLRPTLVILRDGDSGCMSVPDGT